MSNKVWSRGEKVKGKLLSRVQLFAFIILLGRYIITNLMKIIKKGSYETV